MSTLIAFKSTDPRVIEAWQKFLADSEDVRQRRSDLSEAVGRNLYVNRKGFGHGTRLVGFERFDTDKDGDLLHHGGCLIVSSERGQHNGLVVPNLRRKAGKEFAAQLRTYDSPDLDLPGMPGWHIGGGEFGLSTHAPAIFHEDIWGDGAEDSVVVYAQWACDDVPVDTTDNLWEPIPLSEFYAAKERRDEQD